MSELMDWLFDKTPSDEDAAPPLPPELRGDQNDGQIDEDLEPPAESYELERVRVAIDYVDSRNKKSRRRVTLLKVQRGPTAPILAATCHERRAFRHFRTDRIADVIDTETGEIFECDLFFRDVMKIDLARLQPNVEVLTATKQARGIRDELRAPLSILVALARSDEDFHPDELDAICRYVEEDAKDMFTPTHPGEIDTIVPLREVIRNMRPSRQALHGYLDTLSGSKWSNERVRRFLSAIKQVVLADGNFVTQEAELLDELGVEYDLLD
jgi:hypothetical protein